MQLFDPITHDLREEAASNRAAENVAAVRAWMTTPVHVCSRTCTAADALRRMRDHDLAALPVLDDQQRVAGLVTDRELAFAVLAREQLPDEIPIRDVLRGPVVTVGCEEPLSRALALMEEHRSRRLPVVDDEGHPVGVLCLSDLVRAGAADALGIDGAVVARVAGALNRRGV